MTSSQTNSLVEATTVFNNGVINGPKGTFSNKCFFISVARAFNYTINAYDLAEKYHMLNHNMIDTNVPGNSDIVKSIAKEYGVQIDFYIGRYHSDKWYTTSVADASYGQNIHVPTNIIRILNKGTHFEFLLSVTGGFQVLVASNDEHKSFTEQLNHKTQADTQTYEHSGLCVLIMLLCVTVLLFYPSFVISVLFMTVLFVHQSKLNKNIQMEKTDEALIQHLLAADLEIIEQINTDEEYARQIQ